MPSPKSLHERLPAAAAALLFHALLIAVLLNAIPRYYMRAVPEHETIIPLISPEKKEARVKPLSVGPAAPGSVDHFRFNYRFIPAPSEEQPGRQALRLALLSCAPENFDLESDEIRAACGRIGMIIAANPGAFGLAPDYRNGKRWERELLIKQTPLLLPCMSPNGNVLYTLFCLADVVGNGYNPDKLQHYSK